MKQDGGPARSARARAATRFVVGAAIASAATPLARALMVRSGTLDVPNARSSHETPVPRGGGLAVATGALLGGVLTTPSSVPVRTTVAIGVLAGVGLADDLREGLSPRSRLVAQVAAGTLMSPDHQLVGAALAPAVVNVVNFMDGINGIVSGTTAVWGASLAVPGSAIKDAAAREIASLVGGAALGFLPWNAPRAQMFLGDVGSYLVGGAIAASLSRLADRPAALASAAAPLGLFGVDTAVTLARRWRTGDKLTQAHRSHVYQQLVHDHGLSHAEVSLFHGATAASTAWAWRRGLAPGLAMSATTALIYLALPRILHSEGAVKNAIRRWVQS